MHRFTKTFVRTLAIFTITSLVGCDEQDIEDLEDIEDIEDEDIEDEDAELRVGGPPIAGIPADHFGVETIFKVPMQPVAKFKSKLTYALHIATNPSYMWTPDPTGALNTIVADASGAVPYSGNLPLVDGAVCAEFLEDYPFYVPVITSTDSCAAIEQGCCDYICYLWEGWAEKDNGQNVTTVVDDATWAAKEMLWGTYVDDDHMEWTMQAGNGGYSPREKVCACSCKTLPPP
jgi:hypothetical protein